MVIPTFNELSSLPGIVARLRAAVPGSDVLVVDDNSPDGTGRVADELAASDDHVHVLHRSGKEGLGAAYRAGFAWALERDYGTIVEMDADGSHQPEQLPGILAAVEAGANLAIGTRWMPGGAVENWPLRRQLLSRGGTGFARIMLRTHLRDITSGYRAYRASALEAVDLTTIHAQGYCFQIEMAWHVDREVGGVAEVPIRFVERTQGASKMSTGIVVEAMWSVFWWGLRDRVRHPRLRRE